MCDTRDKLMKVEGAGAVGVHLAEHFFNVPIGVRVVQPLAHLGTREGERAALPPPRLKCCRNEAGALETAERRGVGRWWIKRIAGLNPTSSKPQNVPWHDYLPFTLVQRLLHPG